MDASSPDLFQPFLPLVAIRGIAAIPVSLVLVRRIVMLPTAIRVMVVRLAPF
jgi:hypothetical protein